MFDYAARRARLSERLRAEGVDALFLGLSADLEYLTGIERGIPFFGQSSYAHGWVAGGFFRPDADPVFVLPRMVVTFDLPVRPDGELVVVSETDDGAEVFQRVAKGLGALRSVAVGDRLWAETTLELARIFGVERLRTGSSSSTSSAASRNGTSSRPWAARAGPSSRRCPRSRHASARE